jgi:putative endonuclease
MSWFCYILKCDSKNVTYVGITTNILNRLKQHNGELSGGAKFTRGNKWTLYGVISNLENRSISSSIEYKIKHSKKYGLINKINIMANLIKDTNLELYVNESLYEEFVNNYKNENIKINNLNELTS